jgi:hypothetical protein
MERPSKQAAWSEAKFVVTITKSGIKNGDVKKYKEDIFPFHSKRIRIRSTIEDTNTITQELVAKQKDAEIVIT